MVDDIKRYAIENTDFYKNYKVGDAFPVMDKMAFIKNHDAIKSREVFNKPLHVSSTSGSTGTPFKVEQDSEKRSRTIADLKVFGELALYNAHEKMLFIKEVYGRGNDQITDSNDALVDPHNISRGLCGVKGIMQWQFIQKDRDIYLLKVTPSGSELEIDDIQIRLKKVLGDGAKIEVEKVQELPVLNSQKRKAIVNEYKK